MNLNDSLFPDVKILEESFVPLKQLDLFDTSLEGTQSIELAFDEY